MQYLQNRNQLFKCAQLTLILWDLDHQEKHVLGEHRRSCRIPEM